MNNDFGYEKALEIITEANKKRPIACCCTQTIIFVVDANGGQSLDLDDVSLIAN